MRLIVALFLFFSSSTNAAKIPSEAWQYQRQIQRAAWNYFGTDKYLAVTNSQLRQESNFNKNAVSWAGAEGIAQFMPATAKSESKRCGLGAASPHNPTWSINANACHMADLIKRNYEFWSGCQRVAAALSGYNGGQGNVNKQRLAWANGERTNPNIAVYWFDGVENYRIRGKAAHKENRDYPRIILLVHVPLYSKTFGGDDLCSVLVV